jgi:predicted nucleic acid-binding protein
MIKKAFVDTNVFIYAFEQGESEKKTKALHLFKNTKIHIITSIQVLNEFISATVKKGLLSKDKAIETALLIENEFDIIPLDHEVFLKAMEVYKGDKIHASLWDSLIIASALVDKCNVLYTEDMQDNFSIEKLIIRNPFINEMTPI